MDFRDQIKKIRKEHNLTQDELSTQLNVTRQAVSNWENNRNLPDIEMIILISNTFQISLDELILGGVSNPGIAVKLIKDGSENMLAKMNLINALVGLLLLLSGVVLIFIKSASVEYIDPTGILHENFFLLPIAYIFLISGFISFITLGVRNIKSIFKI